jgi:hypothetical protein
LSISWHDLDWKLVRQFLIFNRDKLTCAYCLRTKIRHGIELNLEHFIPQSAGGSDEWSNLVTSCSECNRLKGYSSPSENEKAEIAGRIRRNNEDFKKLTGIEIPFRVESPYEELLGQPTRPHLCPHCQQNALLRRFRHGGFFWGCPRFPACTWRENISIHEKEQLKDYFSLE